MESPDAGESRGHPLLSLIVARLLEFIREPAAIFWVYVFPLILVVALGLAFRDKPVGGFTVVIPAGSGADHVRRVLTDDGRFRVSVCDAAEGRRRLRTRRAELLIVPRDEATAGYDYHFDPTQANSLLARQLADDLLQRAAQRRDTLAVQNHAATEPGGRYIDFLVPGLLGMGLLGGGMWGVGFSLVDMRLRKLLKRYLATPMRRSHFLLASMISRLLFTIPEVLLLLLFSRWLFGVTSQGSYATVAFLILLGTFEFAGIGLLVASRAQTIEAVSGIMNAVMLPMWIGSGIFFSPERFPESLQPLLALLPLTPAFRITWQGSALSPDGRWLARSVNDQAVIYDISRGRITARLPSKARDFAFSPDSGHCAYSTSAGVAIVDVLNGEVVWRRAAPGKAAFAPNGTLIAVASKTVEVWNWRENRAVRRLAAGDIDAIAFSSDGELLAEVGHFLPEDRWERPYELRYRLRVRRIASGDLAYETKGAGRVAALAFDDRSRVLTVLQTTQSWEVRIYDLNQRVVSFRTSLARSVKQFLDIRNGHSPLTVASLRR
jgi:ABC-2 type transport system permease protein